MKAPIRGFREYIVSVKCSPFRNWTKYEQAIKAVADGASTKRRAEIQNLLVFREASRGGWARGAYARDLLDVTRTVPLVAMDRDTAHPKCEVGGGFGVEEERQYIALARLNRMQTRKSGQPCILDVAKLARVLTDSRLHAKRARAKSGFFALLTANGRSEYWSEYERLTRLIVN